MSINLESMSTSALVALYNARTDKPVKKFASRAEAIKRVEKILIETVGDDEAVNAAMLEANTPEAADEPVEVREVEAEKTFDEIAAELGFEADGQPDSTSEIEDAPAEPDAVETSGLDPVETQPFEGSVYAQALEAAELTDLQYRLLDAIAHSQWSPVNCATPTSKLETGTWYYADVFAGDIGISEQAVGGVTTSLTERGLIVVHIEADPKESVVDFTDEGFAAWQLVHGEVGSLPKLKSEETDSGDTSPAAPTASGFTYKTRDELKALADADPEARAAYRAARRLAARKARKAKKVVVAA